MSDPYAFLGVDRNATDLIHVESVVTIASQLQAHLERLANETV